MLKLEEKYMLNEEICKLRDELNKKIEDCDDYDSIYNISLELDKLIAEYYFVLK
ncbi:MAG: aspartyl-phosphate phosphatase Spo0E family protein [Oscillospiraceae bacterium]|nr:aspartyl-phosphate phosphatase Spo0E family protein [Oscillospiraceae bacterium]